MGWKIASRPDCKWCRRAKAHLAIRGVEFEEDHYATGPEQVAFKKATGHDTFPQIWDGDTLVGGYDALKKYLA